MPRSGKPRAPRKRIAGFYPIDTGNAEIIPAPERDGAYILEVNRVPSSRIVQGAPRVLGFDYMEWIAAVLRTQLEGQLLSEGQFFNLVHLGGAGCSLPRYCADVWPHSRNTVVELDAALSKLVRQTIDVPSYPHLSFRTGPRDGEARNAVHSLPAGTADAIIRDAFAGPVTPRHLTTIEFYRAAARALRPGGVYVANVGDRAQLPECRAELAGMLRVFAHVGAIGTPEVLAGRAYGNVVLYGCVEPPHQAITLPQGAAHRDTTWARSIADERPRTDRRP